MATMGQEAPDMAKRPLSPGPNSNNEVNADRQRLAVRLLREAGENGLTRENLSKDLNCSTRQVDRTMLVLATAGAELDKQRYTRDGVSLVRIVMKKGPKWDEFITPKALTALRIAMMALEQVGTEVWAEHLEAFEQLTGPNLSTRDRIIFNSLVTRVRMNGTVTDPVTLDPDVLAAVLTALGAPGGPLQLELTYTPPGREPWTRAVCPFCLTHDAFSGGAFFWSGTRRNEGRFICASIESNGRSPSRSQRSSRTRPLSTMPPSIKLAVGSNRPCPSSWRFRSQGAPGRRPCWKRRQHFQT